MRKPVILAVGALVVLAAAATIAYLALRPPRIAHAFLTPEHVRVEAGATQRFEVYGVRTNGDTVPLRASYRSTGGPITSAGLYTAGPVPGLYQVFAVAQGDEPGVPGFEGDEDGGGEHDEDGFALAGTVIVTGPGPEGGR